MADSPDDLVLGSLAGAEAAGALQEEWESLWRNSPAATPFQHPAWLLAWLERNPSQEPLMLAVRRNEQLVALAPMAVLNHRGDRTLKLMGSGASDYQDILAVPAHADRSARMILEAIAERVAWDRCELEGLPPESPLVACGLAVQTEADPRPVLSLEASPDASSPVIPRRMSASLRYSSRRAERLGPVSFEEATQEKLDEFIDSLFRLHRLTWERRGEQGMLAQPAVQRLHRRAARGFLQHGLLRLFRLRIGDRIVSVCYGFAAHRRAFYYLGGYDPGFASVSPGTLIIGHAISEARRHGDRSFDFLRGSEPYKYAWGAKDRPAFRALLE